MEKCRAGLSLLLIGSLISASMWLGYCLGRWYADQLPPRVETVYVPSPPEIVEHQVEVVREQVVHDVVTLTKEVPRPLCEFADVSELEAFLAQDDTNNSIILRPNTDGTTTITGYCEDAALQLQQRALAAGFYMSVTIFYPPQFQEYYNHPLAAFTAHAANLVVIGDYFWYIEPQTDRVWRGPKLD